MSIGGQNLIPCHNRALYDIALFWTVSIANALEILQSFTKPSISSWNSDAYHIIKEYFNLSNTNPIMDK